MNTDKPNVAVPRGRDASLGSRIQDQIDGLDARAARFPGGRLLLGIALAAAVVLGGIGAFVLVWAVLVGLLA